MTQSHKAAATSAGVVFLLITLVWFMGDILGIEPERLIVQQKPSIETLELSRTHAIETSNQVINYLSSVMIGMFVVLGFSLTALNKKIKFMPSDYWAIILFLVFAFLSIYLSYSNMMLTARFFPRPLDGLNSFLAGQQTVLVGISWQATFTALAAVPATFLVARSLYSTGG